MNLFRVRLVLFSAWLLILAACGSESSPTVADDAASRDTRFTTAEELVNEIRRITRPGQADHHAYLDLVYAETEAQEDWMRFIREFPVPRADCDQAARERFGTGIYHDPREASLWTLTDVELVESDGQRATVSSTNMNGDEDQELQLVKVGDRWWISGYTWELLPTFDAAEIAELAVQAAGLGAKLEKVAERIRAREFESAEEASEAFDAVWSQHNRDQLPGES
jgi:hypothetical protein